VEDRQVRTRVKRGGGQRKTTHARECVLLCFVLFCFIDPKVRKIRNEASSCPGIFSRTLRFYYVARSPGSPLPHLLDRHRKLVGSSAIPARSCPGPVRYHWGSIIELEVPPDETAGLMTLQHHNTNVSQSITYVKSPNTHPTDPIQDKKTNAFDTSMVSPSRQHNFTVRVSHRYIITAAECGRSHHRPSLGAPAVQYPGLILSLSEFGRSRHRVWALLPSLGALRW